MTLEIPNSTARIGEEDRTRAAMKAVASAAAQYEPAPSDDHLGQRASGCPTMEGRGRFARRRTWSLREIG